MGRFTIGSRVLQAIARGRPLKAQHRTRPLSVWPAAADAVYTSHSCSPGHTALPFSRRADLLQPMPESLRAGMRFLSESTGSSKILVVNSDAEFSNALNKAQDSQGVAIVYFTAKWCGPCQTIAPIVENLSKNYSNVTFLKVDVDQENLVNTLASSHVSSVPTFHFYKNGIKASDLIGADPARLKEIVGNLAK